jgi:hypothetical protein
MEIAKYNDMMAHLTRKRLAEGNDKPQVIPLKKPAEDPLELFKKKSDTLLQASFASTNKDYFNSLIQAEYEKAREAGVSAEDALDFLKERSQMYRTLVEEGRMQGEPATLGPSYGRENFYKAGFVESNPEGQQYVVKFASKSTSPGYPDKFIGTQRYATLEEANKAIEDRKLISKKNIAARDQKNVEMGKAKKSDYKNIIDSFFEKGDYENFKTKIYESQMDFKLPSGKKRRTTGGRVPSHIINFIRDRLDAGPGTELFEELKEISGRTDEELLEFKSKIPEKGFIPTKERSKTAAETSGVRKTDEEKRTTEQKTKKKRAEAEAVGTKYASEQELQNFQKIKKEIADKNKLFASDPDLINSPQYAKVKEMMEIRIAPNDLTLPSGKEVKAGEIYRREVDSKGNPLTDEYYRNKAKSGKLFSFFDINKVGTRMGKFASNANITPGDFNSAFIEGQVEKFFRKGGRFYGDTEKLKNVDNYLKSVGVKVKISDVGRIGGGDPVFFDSKTGDFPHIKNTLNIMGFKDDSIKELKPTTSFIDKASKAGKYGLIAGVPISLALGVGQEVKADETEQVDSEDRKFYEDYPLTTGAATAATPLVTKKGRKIYGALAKNLLRALGSVPAATYFAGKELTSEDPSYAIAGADLLLPELGKRVAGSGSGIMSTVGRFLTNPIGRLARSFTPIGIGLQGVELVNQAIKEQRRIDDMRENDPEAYQQYLAEQKDLLRESAAYGGRMGFADGPEDPSKRKFMKIMGGLASLPIIGRFFDVAKEAAPVIDAVKTEVVKGKPEWFDLLVNKVIRTGEDVTERFATKERETVNQVNIADNETVRVYQDTDEGTIRVEYESPDNMGEGSVDLVYKKELPDEGNPNPSANFYATELEPRGIRTGPDDYDIEFDGENYAEDIGDLMSDTTKLKEFATGEKRTMKEIVESKKKKDKTKAMNESTMEQAEYLESKYGPGDDLYYQDYSDYD